MYRNSHKQKITLATDSCSEGDFDKRGALNIPLSISFLSYYYLPTLSRYSVGVIPTCALKHLEITRIINADHIRNLGHIKFSDFY